MIPAKHVWVLWELQGQLLNLICYIIKLPMQELCNFLLECDSSRYTVSASRTIFDVWETQMHMQNAVETCCLFVNFCVLLCIWTQFDCADITASVAVRTVSFKTADSALL